MRTETKEIYTFEELSEKVQQEVIEKNRLINIDDAGYWYEWTLEDWRERLAEKGFSDAEIWFSGFCSQGDGACFDADVNLDVFLADNKFRHLRKVKDHIFVSIKKNSYAFHYSHEKTRYVDCYIDGPATGATARLDALVEKLAETIESERYSLSCEIYRDLEDSFDSMISDEAVKETLVENDYEFYKDGKQAN